MKDYPFIKVSRADKTLEIENPRNYPLIGAGSQSAVFKLTDEHCVKVYADYEQARAEALALRAGKALTVFPRLMKTGANYIIMEYINGPTLKEYLKNCTYMPEAMGRKLLSMLNEMKEAGFKVIDASIRHIYVLENEVLKVADHVHAFKREQPVPVKLLKELDTILLKDSFLAQVKKLEPDTYSQWEQFFNENHFDYKKISVASGGGGEGVRVDGAFSQALIGSGHQGAVFRIAEDRCVKVYGKTDHAKLEQKVLQSSQKLSFIPKVYETGANYTVMEYLLGPDLNTFLKRQSTLSEEITRHLLTMLKAMKKSGFTQIDAPLRHVIVTNNGLKLIDHVYSYTKIVDRPVELFQNLQERNFLDAFLEQVKSIDPKTYKEWMKTPVSLANNQADEKTGNKKREHHHHHHHHNKKEKGKRR
jgi:predicted Ser/Thr protein kinase